MRAAFRIAWDLIKTGKLRIEIKANGIEAPILKEDLDKYGVKADTRPATVKDIKLILETETWKDLVISGRVFHV